jgi:predicted CxxxxCH...CXXCH cytochrome family protein
MSGSKPCSCWDVKSDVSNGPRMGSALFWWNRDGLWVLASIFLSVLQNVGTVASRCHCEDAPDTSQIPLSDLRDPVFLMRDTTWSRLAWHCCSNIYCHQSFQSQSWAFEPSEHIGRSNFITFSEPQLAPNAIAMHQRLNAVLTKSLWSILQEG